MISDAYERPFFHQCAFLLTLVVTRCASSSPSAERVDVESTTMPASARKWSLKTHATLQALAVILNLFAGFPRTPTSTLNTPPWNFRLSGWFLGSTSPMLVM